MKATQPSIHLPLLFIGLTFAVLGLLLLDIGLGSVKIPAWVSVQLLLGLEQENEVWSNILYKIRLPRALTAMLVGAGLSVSGLQMQTLFRNPLAGPSILGITSGASLGVAFVMLFSGSALGFAFTKSLDFWGSWISVGAAILGASAVMLLLLLLAWRVKDNVILLILGLMIGNLTMALVSVGQYFSRPEEIQAYLLWSFGSLGGLSYVQLQILFVLVLSGLLLSMFLAQSLNVLLLGEAYAQSLGLPIYRIRLALILLTGVLSGSITAFCGPIAFVGVAVPHLARAVSPVSDHKILTPLTALCGIALMLFCDIIAKLPGSSYTLPINAVTALIGSPIIILVILRSRGLRHSF